MRMKRPLSTPAIVALAVFLIASTSAAGAHTSSTYYFGSREWFPSRNVNYYFHTSLPNTSDWRNSIRAGDGVWDALGGTTEPDFFSQTVSSSGYSCAGGAGSGRSAVHYGAIDGATGILGVTTWCIPSGEYYLDAFRILYDSAEVWYSGSGDAPPDQRDVRSVSAHEFGHATGFYGHFTASDLCGDVGTDQTMCGYYTPGTERFRTLETHDVHTFEGAY